ncbi:hypothetical protein HII36_41145 [Nonomuraea sp. NN258]|uniref:hypothetical protein n=1 Tax=Nonomuraea antri TaxID=2730852 RepID=UPI001569FFF2|nr:hypothetical protein [Nonomuraea antri]NRQ38193.1 hypothetical protein [Nonomuraea antri]
MFFEPPPAEDESARPAKPEWPPWSAPPSDEMGAVIVSRLVLARTPNVAIVVPTIQAFSTGCLINADVVTRRHSLSPDDFQSLQMAVFPHMVAGVKADQPLPDRLLRFGVRFADGTKATTVGQRLDRTRLPQDPPPGPHLSMLLPSMSMRSGDDDAAVLTWGLWLWPSPPRERFELAVEWPAGGVELSIVELDGAAIADAAQRAVSYWAESLWRR